MQQRKVYHMNHITLKLNFLQNSSDAFNNEMNLIIYHHRLSKNVLQSKPFSSTSQFLSYLMITYIVYSFSFCYSKQSFNISNETYSVQLEKCLNAVLMFFSVILFFSSERRKQLAKSSSVRLVFYLLGSIISIMKLIQSLETGILMSSIINLISDANDWLGFLVICNHSQSVLNSLRSFSTLDICIRQNIIDSNAHFGLSGILYMSKLQILTENLNKSEQYLAKVQQETSKLNEQILTSKLRTAAFVKDIQSLNRQSRELTNYLVTLKEQQVRQNYKKQKLLLKKNQYQQKVTLQQNLLAKKQTINNQLNKKLQNLQGLISGVTDLETEIEKQKEAIKQLDTRFDELSQTMSKQHHQLLNNKKIMRNKEDQLHRVKRRIEKMKSSLKGMDEKLGKENQGPSNLTKGEQYYQTQMEKVQQRKNQTDDKNKKKSQEIVQMMEILQSLNCESQCIKQILTKQEEIYQFIKTHKRHLSKMKELSMNSDTDRSCVSNTKGIKQVR